jgi:hypothetical protein
LVVARDSSRGAAASTTGVLSSTGGLASTGVLASASACARATPDKHIVNRTTTSDHAGGAGNER